MHVYIVADIIIDIRDIPSIFNIPSIFTITGTFIIDSTPVASTSFKILY